MGVNGKNGKRWRGSRTTVTSTLCSANLCIHIKGNLEKFYWSIWNSSKDHTPQQTNCPPRETTEKQEGQREPHTSDKPNKNDGKYKVDVLRHSRRLNNDS